MQVCDTALYTKFLVQRALLLKVKDLEAAEAYTVTQDLM